MSDYLYDLLALQNHSMEPYIFHISNYSKFPVCWNILISHILFIRTGTHISKSFFNIAFITKIENILFLFHNYCSLKQKFALIEGKIQNKEKGIFHHKNFNLEKKKGNYINKSIQP